jgi:thioesterase domain-containing protein/acyl carrier protein
VEEELAKLFASLLGVAQVGVEDSFFDLGGHSLIAVRLFAQVKRAFGTEFPMSVLFEAPSVAALAERIIERTGGGIAAEPDGTAAAPESQPDYTHLVQLHPGDGTGRRPFFLVAGMFGNVLNLRHLALLVGKDRPVYGLQAKGLVGEDAPHSRVEDAARRCLAEIRQIQPEGPYLLGGFSGGGITAYEMAQQLRAMGEEVQALIMLDTPLPQRRPLSLRDRVAIQALNIRQEGPAYLSRWVTKRLRWELDKRRGATPDAAAAQGGLAAVQFHKAAIEAAFLTAVASYQVKPWSGPFTLLRPPMRGQWQVAPDRLINSERAYVLHDNDWGQWVPDMQVIEVPGDHDSMVLEPNVRVMATHLRRLLNDADTHTNLDQPTQTEAAE